MLSKLQERDCIIGRDIEAGISDCLLAGYRKYINSPISLLVAFLDCRYKTAFNSDIIARIKQHLLDHCKRLGANASLCERVSSDFQLYLNESVIIPDMNPLHFWENAKQYRTLAPIAASFFRIVTNSMSCERAFSTMGWINSPRRASITPENLVAFTRVYKSMTAGAAEKQLKEFCVNLAHDVLEEQVAEEIEKAIAEEINISDFNRQSANLILEISSLFQEPAGLYELLNCKTHMPEVDVSEDFDQDILNLLS